MDHDRQSHQHDHTNAALNWVILCFLVAAGYFLILEHRAHLEGALTYLPYLLLLACPLMHLFMHHGHGGHGEHQSPKDDRREQK
jgi:hypothetical protein